MTASINSTINAFATDVKFFMHALYAIFKTFNFKNFTTL